MSVLIISSNKLNLIHNWQGLRYNMRELKQRRRRRQRERWKSSWFRLANQQLCTCITLFCPFLWRSCTTTSWDFVVLRFMGNVNTRQQFSFSFPELLNSLLEFNSRKICHNLMNWGRWNKLNIVWNFWVTFSKPSIISDGANNWCSRHWQITVFCDNRVQ